MNAKELLQTYLSSIQNTEAAAALFADDGVIELPTANARAQGPVAIQRFLTGLLARVPDFQFENVRIWIETPDRVFGEYDARGHVAATGKSYKQPYAGLLSRSTERSSYCTKRSTLLQHREHSVPTASDPGHSRESVAQGFSSADIQMRTYSGQLRRTTRSPVSQSRR